MAGGVTTVFDMPNNFEPIFTYEKLMQKMDIAKQKAVCEWGLYFGTDGENTDEFEKVADKVVGLKLYLSLTTGRYVVNDEELVEQVFQKWSKGKVIVVHAEDDRVDLAIKLAAKYQNKLHITHVNNKEMLEKIISAKKNKLNLTCDVTPHHLFLSREQISGKDTSGVARRDSPDGEGINDKGFYSVKPPLATQADIDFLWDNIDQIDCIATDHAPHTIDEKRSMEVPSGIPGLETMLPLLLTTVHDGRLTLEELMRLTNTNPQKIFGFKQAKETFIEVDLDEKYKIENKNLKTKCGWSPFDGWEVNGKVNRVFIRGIKIFEDGKILVEPSFGKNILQ